VIQFKISHVFSAVESQCLKSLQILKSVLVIIKSVKLFCHYNSFDVLYGGRIYNMYVDAVIVSAWYAYMYVCVCVYIYIYGHQTGLHKNKLILAILL